MPSALPANLPKDGPTVLIAASSGRALASAARRAGWRPLVADFFDDLDTRHLCAANCLVEGGIDEGFTAENLLPALFGLAKTEVPCGLVYGAGFEDRPELLELTAQYFPILGNAPDVVRTVKEPRLLADLCAGLKIPHPDIRLSKPTASRGWLAKRQGGAGGSHIAPAGWPAGGERIYYQRWVPGEPISILLLGNGEKVEIVGLSRQWTDPAPLEPYRFGGSLRPVHLPPKLEGKLRRAAQSAAIACGLRGLNSVDFVVSDSDFWLVEINPRPGATLDIFDNRKGALFRAHIEASRGVLLKHRLKHQNAAASAVAYARRDIGSMPQFAWPSWTADHEKAQSFVRAQAPLCTVLAKAATPDRARALLAARLHFVLNELGQIQDNPISGKETAH